MIGLYIHIPFCQKRCYYCDFSTAAYRQPLIDRYLHVLYTEINHLSTQYKHLSFDTLFLGGGTPSLLSNQELIALFDHLYQAFQINSTAEITIETNPETLTRDQLHTLRALGINRLSIGIQSLHNHHLHQLGRIHTKASALKAYQLARNVGFENINLDLMFALLKQTLSELKQDLEQMIALQPEHISTYSLTIEEKTLFGKWLRQEKIQKIDDDLDAVMYELIIDQLETAGYTHYEISNFARPKYECRHNLIYWQWGNYLGLGVGAHSHFDEFRWANDTNILKYMRLITEKKSPITIKETLSLDQQQAEFVFLALRTRRGVNRSQFEAIFGISLQEKYGDTINQLLQQGLLQQDEEHLFLTRPGVLLADQVCCQFM